MKKITALLVSLIMSCAVAVYKEDTGREPCYRHDSGKRI